MDVRIPRVHDATTSTSKRARSDSEEDAHHISQRPPSSVRKRARADQPFRYLCVFDLEATCGEKVNLQPQEVIQFPSVLVDTRAITPGPGGQGAVVALLNQYVRPTLRPRLSTYCTELTGITQEQVDSAATLPRSVQLHMRWLARHVLGVRYTDALPVDTDERLSQSVLIIAHGPWDLKTALPVQLDLFGCKPPLYLRRWHDLKTGFAEVVGPGARGMLDMLKMIGLEAEGHHHDGLDDARNLARIALELLRRGLVFDKNAMLLGFSRKALMLHGHHREGIAATPRPLNDG